MLVLSIAAVAIVAVDLLAPGISLTRPALVILAVLALVALVASLALFIYSWEIEYRWASARAELVKALIEPALTSLLRAREGQLSGAEFKEVWASVISQLVAPTLPPPGSGAQE